MAKIGHTQQQTNSRFRSYTLDTFTADTDFTTVLDIGNFRTMALEIKGISGGDVIEVKGYTAYNTSTGAVLGDGVLIQDSTPANPFIADGLHQVNVQAFAAITVTRVGGAGTDINGYLSLGY